MADNSGWSLDPLPNGWALDPTPEEKQWTVDPLAPRKPSRDEAALSGGIAPRRVDIAADVKNAKGKPPPRVDTTDVPAYLAHGLESGLYSVGAMGGDVAESMNPVSAARNLWLTAKDAAHQIATGGDRDAYLRTQAEKDASTPFTRFADRMTREAQALGETPDGQKYNDLRYATTDPEKSALLSPVRVVHDALQSLPSTAAMATTVFLTRGAAVKAYGEALAAGYTKAEANAIAVQAAGRVATLAGALGEGTVGGIQQGEQTRQQVLDGEEPTSRIYNAMLKAGVSKADAKQYVATEAGNVAGGGAAVVDALTNALEGPILGKIISEGGNLPSRIIKGVLAEGTQEAVQGAGEQVSQNYAQQKYVDPKQALGDQVAENVIASFAVGGVTGGAFTGVGGVREHTAMARGADLVTPEDHSSPLPTDLIQQGKGTIAQDLDKGTLDLIDKYLPEAQGTDSSPISAAPSDSNRVTETKTMPGWRERLGNFNLDGYKAKNRRVESGGNDQAANPLSSASGRYQFTDSTWAALGGDPTKKNDPDEQERLMDKLTLGNAERLAKEGFQATDGNLYLAHFLGVKGAIGALERPNDEVSAQVQKANPFAAGWTNGQLAAWANRKMGGKPGAWSGNPNRSADRAFAEKDKARTAKS
jgi:hypothetical protein